MCALCLYDKGIINRVCLILSPLLASKVHNDINIGYPLRVSPSENIDPKKIGLSLQVSSFLFVATYCIIRHTCQPL